MCDIKLSCGLPSQSSILLPQHEKVRYCTSHLPVLIGCRDVLSVSALHLYADMHPAVGQGSQLCVPSHHQRSLRLGSRCVLRPFFITFHLHQPLTVTPKGRCISFKHNRHLRHHAPRSLVTLLLTSLASSSSFGTYYRATCPCSLVESNLHNIPRSIIIDRDPTMSKLTLTLLFDFKTNNTPNQLPTKPRMSSNQHQTR